MNASTDTVAVPASARQWLDALVSGACDAPSFLRGVDNLVQGSGDEAWEVLSLLDQYYRRGKLPLDQFRSLKAHVDRIALSATHDAALLPKPKIVAEPEAPAVPAVAAAPAIAAIAAVAEASAAPVAPERRRPATAVGPAATNDPAIAEPPLTRRAPADAPAETSVTPSNARSTPAEASVTPADALITPAEASVTPADALIPPAEVSVTPADALITPAEASVTPADALIPPAEAGVAAAEARLEPADAVNPAVDDEDAPVDVGLKPNEVAVLPAEMHVAPAHGAPSVGTVLRGRYELVGVLGRGGMGTVFEAVDRFRVDLPLASHRLAIKVMHTVVTDQPELFDELRSEFQHLQSLSHPNIVRVHEFDRDGETAFFTMELLNGTPLSRLFGTRKDAPITRPYALAIIRDIGAAVAHAHSRNVVHGDLNLQNIFLTQAGEVRVLDFGAAHKLKRGPWVSDFETDPQGSAATPAFGSCQVLEGETADVRDDVFSFACVMYMLLTGRHPFQSRTAIEARSLRLVPPRPQGLTPRQWRGLRAGLAFERERRPRDVEQWLRDLRLRGAVTHLPNLAALASEPPRRSFSSFYLALALGLVALAGIALWTKTKQDAAVGSNLAPAGPTGAPADSDAMTATTATATPDTQPAAVPTPTESAASAIVETPGGNPPPQEVPPPEAPPHEPPTVAASPAPAPAARAPTVPAAAPPRATLARVVTPPSPVATSPVATGVAPRSRIELTASTIEVVPGEPVARVTLRRKGNLKGVVSFMWWTEPGTAKSGVDFAAFAPHLEHMGNNQSLDSLLIPIVQNPARREERSFYLVIDDAGPDAGAAVIGRTTAMITLLP
jgi:serine/threonine protein kinase